MPFGKPTNTMRVAGRVTAEVNKEIDFWANYLGMQKTSFLSLCIRIGLNGIIRSVSPEKLLTPEDWKRISEGFGGGSELPGK